jgi:UDP-N-acetylglucosamine 2-epimerase (non-hydrolysing)
MPEETNRIVADAVSDLLFIHSPEARDNLAREGRPESAIHNVGNTMIDTLVAMHERIEAVTVPAAHDLEPGSYLVVTLHRPALVDGPLLAEAIERLQALAADLPVVFPAHPRTRAAMETLGLEPDPARLRVTEPLGYVDFLGLVASSAGVLTDSGGIQEETTFLGIPCFTLRDNTERPITCEQGTNTLLGLDPSRIAEVPTALRDAAGRPHRSPAGWDGRAAVRIVDVLESAWPGDAAVAGSGVTPGPVAT